MRKSFFFCIFFFLDTFQEPNITLIFKKNQSKKFLKINNKSIKI